MVREKDEVIASERDNHVFGRRASRVSEPCRSWLVQKGQKVAIKTTSGRKRLNLHAAFNLENGDLSIIKADTINAVSFLKLLKKIEEDNPKVAKIYLIVDNASYHRSKKLKQWHNSPERRVKLIFLPPYAPYLNAIERLWDSCMSGLPIINTTTFLKHSRMQFLSSLKRFCLGIGKDSEIL